MILTTARVLRPADVARRRRTARRAAHGFSRPALARAENLPEAEVERLLAAPDFQGLVAAYRHLASLPEDEQVAHLARLARMVLHEALARGDLRAALFVLKEQERRRDPAVTLARGVVAEGQRAARSPALGPRTTTPPTAMHSPEPADLDDAARWRGAGILRAAVAAEHEALHPAAATEPASPASVTPAIKKPLPGVARLAGVLAGTASTFGLRLPASPEPRVGPALRGSPRRPRAP